MKLSITRLSALAGTLRRLISGFNPLSLFAANEPGVWYDPSDLTTMFQDAAGTTPVTAVEQPVGLLLDKSRGLVLGSELVTNGTFDGNSTTGWTGLNATLSSTSNALIVTPTTTNALAYAAVNLVVGKSYVIKADIVAVNGSTQTKRLQVGTSITGGQMLQYIVPSTPQSLQAIFVATATVGYVNVYTFDGTNATVWDSISVRELPGAHATQSTATSRPVLSARYNLLTKTEQFDDAAWVNNSANVAANSSAWRITDATVLASGNSQQFVTIVANSPHTFQIDFDKQASGIFAIAIGNFFCYANHATLATFNETMFAGANPSSSVALVSGSRHRLTCTVTLASAGNNIRIFAAVGSMSGDVNNTTNAAATGFLDVYRASLVPANQASLPYQRVNTATDYDTVGFQKYLKFDGIDDSLVTPTITPGTDKAQVFAGVRKLSDAVSFSVLAEFSANWNLSAGSLVVFAPNSVAGTYGAGARGDAPAAVDQVAITSSATAPDTAVLAIAHDIPGDLSTIRRNGVAGTNGTGDKGTGNFLAYPIYIGRRGGTTLPFNGHLYSLAVRFGPTLTAEQITQTETYVAGKTGFTAPTITGTPTIEVLE